MWSREERKLPRKSFQIILAATTYIKNSPQYEALVYEREPENAFNRYAMAVKKEGSVNLIASKAVVGVYVVFVTAREIHSRKCLVSIEREQVERRAL